MKQASASIVEYGQRYQAAMEGALAAHCEGTHKHCQCTSIVSAQALPVRLSELLSGWSGLAAKLLVSFRCEAPAAKVRPSREELEPEVRLNTLKSSVQRTGPGFPLRQGTHIAQLSPL